MPGAPVCLFVCPPDCNSSLPQLPDQQLLQEGLTKSEADDIERIMMQDKLESTDMEATGQSDMHLILIK